MESFAYYKCLFFNVFALEKSGLGRNVQTLQNLQDRSRNYNVALRQMSISSFFGRPWFF